MVKKKFSVSKELKNRVMTLAWNTLYMGIAAGLDYLISETANLNMPVELTVAIGFVLAQASKFIRNMRK